MISFCYSLFWGERKIAQNEQTEKKHGKTVLLVTRSRMIIRREAKFVYNMKQFYF